MKAGFRIREKRKLTTNNETSKGVLVPSQNVKKSGFRIKRLPLLLYSLECERAKREKRKEQKTK
jgi:hypothetical protein